MAGLFKKSLNSVHVPHYKNTHESATVEMPPPKQVTVVMVQHLGPPCEARVKPGDEVKVGQVIGDSEAFLSAPIHSGVSGTVKNIEDVLMPNGNRVPAVVIESDGQQALFEGITPPNVTDKESFIAAVRASGLVGLGGAAFPSHIKFNPKQSVDTLIINAAECEPYITSDYRTIMEDAQNLFDGIGYLMKYIGIKNCIIGVEDNKPSGIEKLNGMLPDGVSVFSLPATYPKGAEKVIIFETTGRVIPEGKLPADIGVLVVNVTSAAFLGQYMKDGVPLVSKRITVDGGAVSGPRNVKAPIGSPIKDIIEFCGGYKNEPAKILYGGPMMGITVYDDSYPILKNTNAIIALNGSQVEMYAQTPCIRCGRCVRACPINLMPLRIDECYEHNDIEGLRKHKVNLCMECGCCAYSCPAKRHLVQTHRLAKTKLPKA